MNYVVTGANRGLGLEFARQLVARGDTVVGTARAGADVEALRATGADAAELDIVSDGSVETFAGWLEGRPIDVLINNAGRQNRASSLAELDLAEVAHTFEVNATAPLRVTRALLPNLRAGTRRQVMCVTSRMGSLADFDRPNMFAYRASKAALNMFVRCIAGEFAGEGFTFLAMHPGWVRTDMGGADAELSPEDSVRGMLAQLDRLTPRWNGQFRDLRGRRIKW